MLRKRAAVVVVSLTATLLAVFTGLGLQREIRRADRNLNANKVALDPPPPSTVEVLTYHNDVARTGQNLEEKILTLGNVNSNQFGKVGFIPVDGLVDAEPLYISNLTVSGHSHNVLFVATEHDSVYAFDANTLAQLWHVTVLGANETPSDNRSCDQVIPETGITSTPVIAFNEGRRVMYLVAMSKDNNGNYFQRLHALDITNGADISGSPTTIEATFPTLKGKATFEPKQYKERAALLFLGGVIYTSWASHCDLGDYGGWMIGYSAATLKQVNVLDLTPNGIEGAIWMSGSGPAVDLAGNIFLLDGNGTFDHTLNSTGFPINGDFGNGFLKLSASGTKLSVTDYFDMHNTDAESNADEDLGSGGALVLPDFKDASGKTWQLAVGAGKDAHIYVVNRNSMGKFNPHNDAIYQKIEHQLTGGVYAAPAYFKDTVYFGAVDDSLKAFSIENAKLVPNPASKTPITFAYPGTTPSISANGTSDAIVWTVEARGSDAGSCTLTTHAIWPPSCTTAIRPAAAMRFPTTNSSHR